MLRLGGRLLPAAGAGAASPSPPTAASLLHHVLLYSTTTAPVTGFVAEDFLVAACGLAPAQARKASRHIATLKSPSNPDAVLAFLAVAGLSRADIAAAVARRPQLLCARVDKTLVPRLALLRDVGLSPPEISRLVAVEPQVLRSKAMIPNLAFYLSLLGSYDRVHTAIRRTFKAGMFLLGTDVERVVKPNIAFLQQCGVARPDVVNIFWLAPTMVLVELERLKEIVACADALGVPRDSAMFKHALVTVCRLGPRKVSARSDFLRKALGCSEAELRLMVRKLPYVLNFAEARLTTVLDYLRTEVGLEPSYIVHRPALLGYSMAGRLVPRHHMLKVLKEKGLVEKNVDFYTAVARPEKIFIKRFIDPYKETVPGLADAYAAACAGQVPPEIQP